jgi:16S rRNA C1402 (ribose-2'-O) methylase RsmI
MTKIHEEYLSGSATELLAELSGRKEQKGEFALIVAGNRSRLSRDEGQDGGEDEVPEPSDGGT